jgi:hypothetical protein
MPNPWQANRTDGGKTDKIGGIWVQGWTSVANGSQTREDPGSLPKWDRWATGFDREAAAIDAKSKGTGQLANMITVFRRWAC